MKKCLAIAVLLWRAASAPRRPSTHLSMAAAPSPSIPIAGRFRFPASTITPARRPSARVARKAILIARPGRRRSRRSPPRRLRPRRQPRLHRLNRLPLLLQPLPPPRRGTAFRHDSGRCAGGYCCASTARSASSRSSRPAGARSRCRASAPAVATKAGRSPGGVGTIA